MNLVRRSRRRWPSHSLRSLVILLATFGVLLRWSSEGPRVLHNSDTRSGLKAFVIHKMRASLRQIARWATAAPGKDGGFGCVVSITPIRVERISIIDGEPATSWFYVWEPQQDAIQGQREERALLESLGPTLGESDE